MKNKDKFIIISSSKTKNANRRIIRTIDEIFEIAKQNGASVNNILINCIRYTFDHR